MDQSHVFGQTTEPLLDCTIGEMFEKTARQFGDRLALISRHQDIRLTYGELKQRVDALANGLVHLGLEPGDRIGLWAPNCVEWVIVQLASARAGFILVNVNPAYLRHELEHCLNLVDCSALVMASGFLSADYYEVVGSARWARAASDDGNSEGGSFAPRWLIAIDDAPPPGYLGFEEVCAMACPESARVLNSIARRQQAGDAINIQFTSGTTGVPKGATMSHRNILNNAYFSGRRLALGKDDRICLPVLLYHCFGMVLGVLTSVSHGACLVLTGEAFDPREVLTAVEAERCTVLHGVPAMFHALLAHPVRESTNLSTLRTGIVSGAYCPADLMRQITTTLHMPQATIGYGMTEVGPLAFQTRHDEAADRRCETVGEVHDHFEAKIVGPDGATVARGVPGEIWFRGYGMMSGYWGDEERSIEAFGPGGWIRSGDLAVMDADGRVRVTGRLKDIIIRGGEKIVPQEIEALLRTHPGILEAHVFGIASVRLGEEVAAWIVARDPSLNAAGVKAFCRQHIAGFKVPGHVQFATQFPQNAAGKRDTPAMRGLITENTNGTRI